MTTTPAPTDLIAHLDPWGGECDCGIEQVTAAQEQLIALFDEWRGDKSYRDHHDVAIWADKLTKPLLDELAKTRAAHDALLRDRDEWESDNCELAEERNKANAAADKAEQERDAAREELAKTRAELDEAKRVIEAARLCVADIKAAWSDERIGPWLTTGQRALFAALDVHDANPATTAEPADEPKADCRPVREYQTPNGWRWQDAGDGSVRAVPREGEKPGKRWLRAFIEASYGPLTPVPDDEPAAS